MNNNNLKAYPAQGVEVMQRPDSCHSGVKDGYTTIESVDAVKSIRTGLVYKIPGNLFNELFDKIFLAIKSNRKEGKQIKAKKQSCLAVGMTTPALVVRARIAKESGYEIINPVTGEEASENDLDDKLIIMEGNTRAYACHAAFKENNEFDYIFILLTFLSPEKFKQAYRQTNLCNERTKVKDYTRDVLATETSNSILKSYLDKNKAGLTPKAAAFATLGKEISKNDIMAIFSGKMPEALKEEGILKFSDRIFKTVREAFAPGKITPLVKGTIFWKWTSSKLNDAKDDTKRESVTTKIEKVFSEMKPATCNAIRDAKGNERKSREQLIHELLDKEYLKL